MNHFWQDQWLLAIVTFVIALKALFPSENLSIGKHALKAYKKSNIQTFFLECVRANRRLFVHFYNWKFPDLHTHSRPRQYILIAAYLEAEQLLIIASVIKSSMIYLWKIEFVWFVLLILMIVERLGIRYGNTNSQGPSRIFNSDCEMSYRSVISTRHHVAMPTLIFHLPYCTNCTCYVYFEGSIPHAGETPFF